MTTSKVQGLSEMVRFSEAKNVSILMMLLSLWYWVMNSLNSVNASTFCGMMMVELTVVELNCVPPSPTRLRVMLELRMTEVTLVMPLFLSLNSVMLSHPYLM